MKQTAEILIVTTVLIIVSASKWCIGQTQEEKGLAIAREAEKLNSGFGDCTAKLLMTLRNSRGQESTREVRVRVLEVGGNGHRSLCIFDSPKDVKGTAFLAFTYKAGDDDQWLYMPAMKRVKRIAARNKSGSFMGSEFSYEDIATEELEKYRYKWLNDEVYDGNECFVIERYPVDKANSGYTRQVVRLDKSEYRIYKVDYYDRKNSLLKTLTAKGYRKYLDKFWRATEMNVVNHQTGKSTVIIWSDFEFHTGLKESDFDKSSLENVR